MRKASALLVLVLLGGLLAACGSTPHPTAPPPTRTTEPTAVAAPPTDASTAPLAEPSPVSSEADLLDYVWQWTTLTEGVPASQSVVPDPENYLLIFRSGGEFTFRADCNNGSGTYALAGTELTLEVGPMTMALCGEDSLDAHYLELLDRVVSYALADGRLALLLADNAGQMTFESGGPAGIPHAAGAIGIDLDSIQLDMQDLPYTWQASLVPLAPYDASQPLGPVGLPEHIEINFGATEAQGAERAEPVIYIIPVEAYKQGLPEHIEINFGATEAQGAERAEPVIYIIPVEAYKQMWEANGDPSISYTMDHVEALMADRPLPIPPFGLPVLPYEELDGVNDLAAQGSYRQRPGGPGELSPVGHAERGALCRPLCPGPQCSHQ